MLGKISQPKKNTIFFPLSMESKKQNKQTHRHVKQIDDCQSGGGLGWVGKMGKEGQETQAFSYEISESQGCHL